MDIKSIKGIEPTSLELLEAAGFADLEALASSGAQAVAAELAKANHLLHVADEDIPAEKVEQWIDQAKAMLAPAAEATDEKPSDEVPPVDYEQSPEVMRMLGMSPFALPLPAKVLMENRVSVNEIPLGIMLNSYVGDLDVRVSDQPTAAQAQGPVGQSPFGQMSGRHDLMRSAKPSTNEGIDPSSRWYIRGVLHSDPVNLYFGALVSLLIILLVPASIVSAVLLVLSRELPDSFPWVSPWLLSIPASLLIIGPAYLIWGLGGRCRICNQRLFSACARHKNTKAHHVAGLGYVLPLCFHMLVFKWFRCTHCGTSVRIKE